VQALPSLLDLEWPNLPPVRRIPAPSRGNKSKQNIPQTSDVSKDTTPSVTDIHQQHRKEPTIAVPSRTANKQAKRHESKGAIPKRSNPVKTVQNNNIKEMQGDIFKCPDDTSLVNFNAADFAATTGVSGEFNARFGQVEKLRQRNVKVGSATYIKTNIRHIFYLPITSSSEHNCEPTMDAITSSLNSLLDTCKSLSIKKLAFHRIASISGYERPWFSVKQLINQIFNGSNINITIYNLSREDAKKIRETRKSKEFLEQHVTVQPLEPLLSPVPQSLRLQYRPPTPKATELLVSKGQTEEPQQSNECDPNQATVNNSEQLIRENEHPNYAYNSVCVNPNNNIYNYSSYQYNTASISSL
jgi:hypothetical protein